MIVYMGKKITTNQLAKEIIFDKGVGIGAGYWSEDTCLEYSKLTEKEKEDIEDALDKQEKRLRKFLNPKYR